MRIGVSEQLTDADRVGFGSVAQGANIRPLGDQVLVLQDDYGDPDEKSAGGIYTGGLGITLPEVLSGTVLAVGPGQRTTDSQLKATGLQRLPLDVRVGERVRWRRQFGTLLERAPGERQPRLLIKFEFLDLGEQHGEEN